MRGKNETMKAEAEFVLFCRSLNLSDLLLIFRTPLPDLVLFWQLRWLSHQGE
jgi:hypothetical protein